MGDPRAKQERLNRLYAQILQIDEDGKDFLKNIVTQTWANRNFTVMSASIRDVPDETGFKAGVKP
ncbi:hypothetical protein AGMMS50212_16360 [Spirochaetia bacterium]|nr:hypothetical protein AGMMS50212_16360 [Spirochaetia bacterium]